MKTNTRLTYLSKGKYVALFMMKSFIFLLCTSAFCFSTNSVLSQIPELIVETDKTISVEEVFDMIDRQTEYSFVYKPGLFDELPQVELKRGKVKVDQLLKRCLVSDRFIVEFNENKIISLKERKTKISPPQVSITGKVTDASNNPLVGVNVIIKDTSNGVFSDENGVFSLESALPATLIISYIGYETQEVLVESEGSLVIVMKPGLFELEDVVVGVTRTNLKVNEIPQKIDIIRGESIEKSNAINATEVLRLSGLEIFDNGNGNARVSLRGFTGFTNTNVSYVLTLIDGTPAGTVNLSLIPSSNIERIEILKGPAAVQYGSSALAGIINIVTKVPKGPVQGGVSLFAGNWSTFGGDFNIGGNITDNMRFTLGGTFFSRNGDYKLGNSNLFTIDDPSKIPSEDLGEDIPNSGRKNFSLNAGLGFDFGEKWTLDLNTTYTSLDNDEFYPFAAFGLDFLNIKEERLAFRGSLLGRLNKHTIKINPYYNTVETVFNDASFSDPPVRIDTQIENTFVYGLQAQDDWAIANNHNLTFGVDLGTNKREVGQFSFLDGSPAISDAPDGTLNSAAAFASLSSKFAKEKLTTVLGLRATNTTFKSSEPVRPTPGIAFNPLEETDFNVSPGLGINYKLSNSLRFHGSLGSGFRVPTVIEKIGDFINQNGVRFIGGGADLENEQSTTFDLGLGYFNRNNGLIFDFTYFSTDFRNRIDGVIDEDPDTGERQFVYFNAGDSELRGMEIKLAYDLGASLNKDYSLRFYFNYTNLFRAIDIAPDGTETDILLSLSNIGSTGVSYTGNKFYATINGRIKGVFVTQTLFPPFDQSESENHLIADLRLGYNLNKNHSINFNVFNLFNERFFELDPLVLGEGRNFRVTYKVNF